MFPYNCDTDVNNYRWERYNHKSCGFDETAGITCRRQQSVVSQRPSTLSFTMMILFNMLTTSTGFQLQSNALIQISTIKPLIDQQNARRRCNTIAVPQSFFLSSDDWSSFQSMDDDDEIVYGKVLDKQEYAVENDSQSVKESVGELRLAPIIERDADPISVVAGKCRIAIMRFHKCGCISKKIIT
jgi:hypothetical protein